MTVDDAIKALRDADRMVPRYGPAWSEAELAEMEQRLKLKAPDELRQFLLRWGIIWPVSCPFLVRFKSGSIFRIEVSEIGGPPERLVRHSQTFLDNYDPDTGQLVEEALVPEGYIFFGSAEGKRTHLLMDGTNPDNNAVYAWGRSYDPWGTGDNTMGLGYVADSLSGFLAGLLEVPDDPQAQ